MRNLLKINLFAAIAFGLGCLAQAEVFFTVPTGPAKAETNGSAFVLSNDLITATYQYSAGKLAFGGMSAKGTKIADKGGELFIVNLQDGTSWKSSSMTLSGAPRIIDLPANPREIKLAHRYPGKAIEAVFTSPDKSVRVMWRAVLRAESHYLRTEMAINSSKDVNMSNIIGMQYAMTGGELSVAGNTRGSLLVTPMAFAALETPMGKNTILSADGQSKADTPWDAVSWTPSSWAKAASSDAGLKKYGDKLALMQGTVKIAEKGTMDVTLSYKKGNTKLNIAGVQLYDRSGKLVSEDIHDGSTGNSNSNNAYQLKVAAPGTYQLKLWAQTKDEAITSDGEIAYSLPVALVEEKGAKSSSPAQMAQGLWSRNTTLSKGQSWELSAVLGVLVPGQERRSFLAYIERERVVPYRPFIHYNSWYELNINRNNDSNPLKRMVESQCVDVLNFWYETMFKKRGVSIDAFVWDDGWDEFNSLWEFHKGFPQGFKNVNQLATKQKAGIGAWLGPVGGYGSSKAQRLDSWNKNHPGNKIGNFQLANEEYYKAFSGRCLQMIKDYDMRYFKFDGISTHFHAKGPDESREEDAEGIIKLVTDLRKARPDLYINCTVGTWASPFWFRYVDSVWRQENDWGADGEGDNREKWITYRDRLVWEVFVQGSPLCPINSLMFHGLIVSKHGPPGGMPNTVEGIRKEMRCSFACGSSLQELYIDRDIFESLDNGVLWDDLAFGIKWIRKYAPALSDVHWVGGCPWDKSSQTGSIYGWASWNGKMATLALRNPTAAKQSITFTLRKALDIPKNVNAKIALRNTYQDQRNLPNFTGKALPLDEEVTLELEPFEVFVFDYESK